jgi:acetyl esterase/lipase
MKRIFVLLFVCALAQVSLQAQAPPSSTAAWVVDIEQTYSVIPNVTYAIGTNYECKLDAYVRRNATKPVPTLVYIHGGGWVGGLKDAATFHLLPWIEMGFSVVNVEYRMARNALAPAAVEDCRLALRWVYKNAKTYNFDTDRIIVTGGSAGGHLALMTGLLDSTAGFDTPREWDQVNPVMHVAAIVNLFGITDVKDLLAGPHRQNYAVSWLGSLPNREELAVQVSPLTYVRPSSPPVLTIHGDNDPLVPYEHAVRLHKALDKAGVANKLVTIPGGSHGGFSTEDMKKFYGTVREFLGAKGLLPQ